MKLPEGLPVAAVVKRTYIVVLLTEPELGVSDTLVVKPLPEVVDASKPVGGVITRFAVRFEPETVKLCSAETTPAQVVKALNVPVAVIVAAVTTFKVKLLLALIQPVVLFLTEATKS